MPHNRHNSGSNGSGNGGDSSNKLQKFGGQNPSVTQCCVPSLCHVEKPIKMDDLSESIKVICNNESCNQGKYMHKACFETWEENVLTYLRSTGRARSWSEKQRLQNLWTKKGYDLAYKACGCKCGKGHLRKDLDWVQPVAVVNDDQGKKKKHRKKKGNDKPSLIISTSMSNGAANNKHHVNGNSTTTTTNGNNNVSSKVDKEQSGPGQHVPSSQHPHPPHQHHNNNSHIHGQVIPMARLRTSSVSSTGSGGSGGTSPPVSGSESQSPGFMDQMSFMKKFFGGDHLHRRQRHDSGSIFSRRQDYSSFNHLPRHKINSYHIKMEDDVNHGNDETRNLILSTLTANRMNRVPCILCSTSMIIFDKYPLIDGTFFVSPTQHSKGAVPCQIDGRTQYLNAVCMSCLEGWNSSLKCKSCGTQWKGSHLILGSMYSYDIFAAVPCCTDRLRCNKCNNLVTSPETHRIRFFSEYSHSLPCGYCGTVSHHYAKPIQTIFTLSGRG